ncbi:hypothetical protein ACLOJK_004410, partial [Asimina triloba]
RLTTGTVAGCKHRDRTRPGSHNPQTGQDSYRIHVQDPEGHSVNEWKRVGKNRTPVAVDRNPVVKTGSIQDSPSRSRR